LLAEKPCTVGFNSREMAGDVSIIFTNSK
jgi:hypothetical protein